jgi:replicative DNA helicase
LTSPSPINPATIGVPQPGRVPPSDLEAEGYVLSWAIMEEGEIDRITATGLLPEHFYADANRRIWESIVRLSFEAGMHVDLVSIAGDLRSLDRLDQIGGTPYLAQLADTIPVEPRPGVLEQHCKTIITHWTARQVQSVAHFTIAQLYQPQGVPTQAIIEEHEQQIWELAHQHRETVYEIAGVTADRALTELSAALRNGGSVGITTGFSELDKKTGGYQEGHLGIIAGRTAMGKSGMLTSSLIRSTRLPRDGSLPVAAYIHSLEMPKEEVALRLVCIEADVEYQKMRLNQVSTTEWDRLFIAAKTLAKQPLIIGDKPGLTVPEFRSVIRKIKREIEQGRIPAKKLSIAAVDYLQLMTGDKSGNRELEVASLSRNLKALAKTEKVCVVALAQVNRDPEKKIADKRPGLSSLRETGALENDSDFVWFVYRDKYYNKEAKDEAEIIIAKQRGGATGTVMLAFHGPTISFRPLAREDYEEFNVAEGPPRDDSMPPDEYWNR